MGTETNKDSAEYLNELVKDRHQFQALPNMFIHADKLLEEEINRVRAIVFHHQEVKKLCLPEPLGPTVNLQEKLFVPVRDHPDFNFVGRILGPRGMTAKELEQQTGCKIMVRGKGSMRDRVKEDQNRGKPNWEHLNEDLHVLITVEDTRNRAEKKMNRAKEEVQRLLVPAPDGEDDLKKRQLMELAIINGTYRDTTKPPPAVCQTTSGPIYHRPPGARYMAQPLQLPLRAAAPSPAGAPIILAPRLPAPLTQMSVSNAGIINGAPPPLVSASQDGTFVYNPYEQHPMPYGLAATPIPVEYQHLDSAGGAGPVTKMRRPTLVGVREHPYSRV